MTKATESTQASAVFTYRKYHHAHTKAHTYLFYILYKMSIYWHIVTLSYLVVHILRNNIETLVLYHSLVYCKYMGVLFSIIKTETQFYKPLYNTTHFKLFFYISVGPPVPSPSLWSVKDFTNRHVILYVE